MNNFIRKLLITIFILCISAGTFAQIIPLSIYSPGDEGMSLYITSQQFRQEDLNNYYTTFNGTIRVLTSQDKTNLVAAKDSSVNIYTKVMDADYSLNVLTGNYVEAFIPTQYRMYYTTLSGIDPTVKTANYGEQLFNKSLAGLPFGNISVNASIVDESVLPPNSLGSIADDGSADASADVWIVDLEEQAGTKKVCQNEALPVKLNVNPSGFPHEDICYIVISWGSGMPPMPGMPPPASNLYEDSTCTTPIVGDNGTTEKRWLIPEQPSEIYYKNTASSGSQNITLKILVKYPSTNNFITLQQKNLNFTITDLKIKSVDSTSNLKGYWTGSLESPYPSPEYLDGNGDGTVSDPIGTVSVDKNRPFVFAKNSDFRIDEIIIKKSSSFSTTGKNLSVTSSDGSITENNIPYTPTSDAITASNFTGDTQTDIESKEVTLTWKLGNTTIGTTTH